MEAGPEVDAEGASALDEEVVEVLAQKDDRRLLGGEVDLPLAGRDQAERVDGIAEAPHLPADAERLEEGHGVGREARSAGLVAGELVLVEEDDVSHAPLREGHGRSGAAGAGADDHDGRRHGRRLTAPRRDWQSPRRSVSPTRVIDRTRGFCPARREIASRGRWKGHLAPGSAMAV
ncbi:MAG: hypothetical protein QM820_42960 [Minicystis sp.]